MIDPFQPHEVESHVAFVMNEITPFKIRDIKINPPLVLSPMAGVTDISFRRLLKQRGVHMVSVRTHVWASAGGLLEAMRFRQTDAMYMLEIDHA